MISSNLDQEEVFSMSNNQMLRFGNSLHKLLVKTDISLLMDDYTSQKGMINYFVAATMYEFIKRIGDNVRTQEDKVKILKESNKDGNFEGFEIDTLGLMQLKFQMVQLTESFNQVALNNYASAVSEIGNFVLE